jgi:PIN domain nuclease of toxin-antitoxin system
VTPLLLDTHAYLWFVFDDPRLSAPAAAAISDTSADSMVSIASLWEITIKKQLGRLELGMELPTFFLRFVNERKLTILPIRTVHLETLERLPLLHRDPFDRLIAAQARVLGIPVVTADPSFRSYGLEVVW